MLRLSTSLLALTLSAAVPLAVAAETTPSASAKAPAAGQPAVDFKLQDQGGHWRSLRDYRGQWLVLYFYPKDFTPGCTSEVCSFRDAVLKLRQQGAAVAGVSVGSMGSHAQFAAKYHAPFPLLADSDGRIAAAYGVLNDEGAAAYARRETFLIDPDGRIAVVYENVDPEKNAAQVLADLARLKQAGAHALTHS